MQSVVSEVGLLQRGRKGPGTRERPKPRRAIGTEDVSVVVVAYRRLYGLCRLRWVGRWAPE